jgi:hypothetical protein
VNVFALPAGLFKHTGDKVAVRGNYLPADGTNPRVFVVCRIAEGAAENVAHSFGYAARLYPALKNNAFNALALPEKTRADGTGLRGIARRSASAVPQPPFLFAAPALRVRLPGPYKKRPARHQGQHEIGKEYRKQKKQGIQKNQLLALPRRAFKKRPPFVIRNTRALLSEKRLTPPPGS